VGQEYASPLKDVLGSVLLGSQDSINFIKHQAKIHIKIPCRQTGKGTNRPGQGTEEKGPNDRKEASDCKFQDLALSFLSAGPTRDSLYNVTCRVAFPHIGQGRHPKLVISELNGWRVGHPDSSGRVPLSTLHVQPHDRPRMTQGHDGAASFFV
jgi:hypothetical protein